MLSPETPLPCRVRVREGYSGAGDCGTWVSNSDVTGKACVQFDDGVACFVWIDRLEPLAAPPVAFDPREPSIDAERASAKPRRYGLRAPDGFYVADWAVSDAICYASEPEAARAFRTSEAARGWCRNACFARYKPDDFEVVDLDTQEVVEPPPPVSVAAPESHAWKPGDRVRLAVGHSARAPRGSEGRIVSRLSSRSGPPTDTYRVSTDSGAEIVATAEMLEPGGPPPPEPSAYTLADVARGAADWQAMAPMERVVHVAIRGHVATVTASLSPYSPAREVKFLLPYRPEAVAFFLDGATLGDGTRPITIGGDGSDLGLSVLDDEPGDQR